MRVRRASAVLVGAAALVVGCGGEEAADRPDGARYLDPRSDVVASISLEYDGEDWAGLKRMYAKAVGDGRVRELLGFDGPLPPTLDGALNLAAGFSGISFSEDIKPLLGGRLLIAGRNAGEVETTAVYEVGDADALQRVIDRLRDEGLEPRPMPGREDVELLTPEVAVAGGDTLVAVLEPGDRDLDTVLAERLRAAADGPPVPDDEDSLVSLRLAPAWLGTILSPAQLDRALNESAAGGALRGAELRADIVDEALAVEGRVDFEGLSAEELPVGPPAPLELPAGEAVASASARQDRTTVFLARIARELLPDSRFVRRVEALERDERLRFEDEVLRAFSGPSASVMRFPGRRSSTFAARSELRDAERMRDLLPRIAPALPGILEGLQGLGRPGLTALLFAAPDAPLTPAAAAFLAQIAVEPRAGGDLYEVRGLDPRNLQPTPDGLVYGLIGDVFVVGSTPELAEHAAEMPLEDADPAGTRLRIDLDRLAEGPFDPVLLAVARALFTTVEVEASAEEGDVRFALRSAAR